MIPTKELRLGNYVKDGNNSFPMYVYALGKDWVQLNFNNNEGDIWECDDKDLVPIPITIELITILGFTPCNIRWQKPVYKMDNILITEYSDGLWQVCVFKELDNRMALIIESLHELQNAYFSTNQKELEVNL